MRAVAAFVAIVLLAIATTATARPVANARPMGEDPHDEEQKKRAAKRTAYQNDDGRPSKQKNPRLQRRMQRNLDTDFRTGIGDNKGRRHALGDDDDDVDD